MPTVFRIGRYRFFFYSKEGDEPPHIHVEAGDCEAKVWLGDLSLARSFGFKSHENRDILKLVEERKSEILAAWEAYFDEEPDRR